MRIAIIAVIGILSYLIVLLPGYFFIVPQTPDEEPADNKTITKVTQEKDSKKQSKLTIANPGDAPPPK
ncbi:MAG: hypothetical protein H8E38_08495 [SAR324 cluster bacterium]|nr:hypothetical protein [SAR324 cluster bacterium]